MRRKVWSAHDVNESSDGTAMQSGATPTGSEDGVRAKLSPTESGSTVRIAPLGGEGAENFSSDIRQKEKIAQIGRTAHALPLYRFHYKGGVDEYVGVMAQDVLKVRPAAVSVGADGFYRVNYRMLGISMLRVDAGDFATTAGGEGIDLSDIRLKDRVTQIGSVWITIERQV